MLRSLKWGSLGLVFGLIATAGASLAAGAFDGTYVGPQRETKNNNSGYCRNVTHDNAKLVVADGVAKYTWGGKLMEAPVKQDGTFYVLTDGFNGGPSWELKGKIAPGNLEADVGSVTCAGHLSLKKT